MLEGHNALPDTIWSPSAVLVAFCDILTCPPHVHHLSCSHCSRPSAAVAAGMADRYATEAARIATLSLIDAAGFDVVQQSCVDMLADLLLRYLHEAGAGSHHYAELAGRSETNPIDVVSSNWPSHTGYFWLTRTARVGYRGLK